MVTRIVILTQWFDPEPTFKGLTFARELVRQGFEVEVVTGFPNYPGGRLYPGYKLRVIQREEIDGVHITRLPLYPNHDSSALRRILNYMSFAASSFFYGVFILRKPDVIYAYHPPLTVGLCAALIRLLRGVPVVYDIQDMWPDTLRATGMLNNARILSVVDRVCSWVYRRVDRIVVLSPGFRRLLIERGVPSEKLEIIYNWCDENALGRGASDVAVPPEFPRDDRFRVVFAGNMGPAQALDSVVAAAKLLKPVAPQVCFVLVGSGISIGALKAQVDVEALDNVVFIPRVPMAEVGAMLNAADALLVHLKNDPLFAITIPSKTQAYMAIGRPVVMAVPGDAAELVERSGGGVVANAQDPQSLADAVIGLLATSAEERRRMGERSRQFYLQEMSIQVGVGRFANCFRSLVPGR